MPLSLLAPRQNSPQNVVWQEGMLGAEDCHKIVAFGDASLQQPATMTGPQARAAREGTVAFLPQTKESAALFQLIRQQIPKINAEHFGFDLVGFAESFQYARYVSGKGHYDWHVDAGPGVTSLRKLSIILQLSDEADYEGGDIEFQVPGSIAKLPRKQGTFAVFSPFLLHRVTAVTRGERKSLVAWITGPPFR
jgi:PKHD-type hydroxylase